MYRSSPLRSTLSTGYITGLDMCKVCAEAVHCAALWTCVQVQKNVIIPTPPHPTLSHVMCARVTLGGKKDANCQSVYAGDSGKWLCAHVTPVCVRGWLWVEKMMQNCACVHLWLQSVCAGDPLTDSKPSQQPAPVALLSSLLSLPQQPSSPANISSHLQQPSNLVANVLLWMSVANQLATVRAAAILSSLPNWWLLRG